jgi:hypothetical protein
MPVLKNLAQTKTVVLPSTKALGEDEQIKVTLYTDVEATKMIQIDESTDTNKAGRIIALYVAKWNLTNEDGTPLDVTPENVARLAYGDFKFLDIYTGELINKSIEAVSDSLKELSSPTLAPPTTDSLLP